MDKDELIKKLLNGSITSEEIDQIMEQLDNIEFRNLIKRIFDINESTTINGSSASLGFIGFLNRIGRKKKNKHVKKNLDKPGYRDNKTMIIAEGDSWFEYPVFLKDIVDWIIEDKNNIVYSLAYGGDWITNIIYEDEYIMELSKYQPEVFLISGGGNDLVGDGRLGFLINKPSIVDFDFKEGDDVLKETIIKQNFGNGEIDSERRAEMIVRGQKYMNKDFLGLLKTFEIMYKLLFKGLDLSGKFDGMKIITQGYDFAIPSNNTKIFVNPMRWVSNNGKWLYYPLVRKGISDTYEQMCIVSAMLYHFNEMLIRVGKHINEKVSDKKRKIEVYHIDCRGAVKKDDWADELHPFSDSFKKIADVYQKCIKNEPSIDANNPYIYPVRFY